MGARDKCTECDDDAIVMDCIVFISDNVRVETPNQTKSNTNSVNGKSNAKSVGRRNSYS